MSTNSGRPAFEDVINKITDLKNRKSRDDIEWIEICKDILLLRNSEKDKAQEWFIANAKTVKFSATGARNLFSAAGDMNLTGIIWLGAKAFASASNGKKKLSKNDKMMLEEMALLLGKYKISDRRKYVEMVFGKQNSKVTPRLLKKLLLGKR